MGVSETNSLVSKSIVKFEGGVAGKLFLCNSLMSLIFGGGLQHLQGQAPLVNFFGNFWWRNFTRYFTLGHPP